MLISFFKKLFSQKSIAVPPPEPTVSADTAPVVQPPQQKRSLHVDYKQQMTQNLKSDHQALLGLHGELMQAAQQADFEQIEDRLQAFSKALKAHLAVEFRDLYVYMEYFAETHSASDRALLRDFRNEMQAIGGEVTGVINRYANHSVSEATLPRMIEDFKNLAPVLVDRIEREEELLYPLYDDYGVRFSAEPVAAELA